MKLFKIINLSITSLISLTPLTLTIACSQESVLDLPSHVYLVAKKIQDSSSRKHIDLSKLKRKDLTKIPPNILGYYKSKSLSGGWAENRQFYKDNIYSTHAGIDLMINTHTDIISPAKAEMVSSYWLGYGKQEFAEGLGGVSFLKIKISDLDINPNLKEFIYISNKNKYYKVAKFVFSKNNIYKEPTNIATKTNYENYINNLSDFKKKELIDDSQNIYISIMHQSKESIGNWKGSKVKDIQYKYNDQLLTWKVDTAINYKNPRILYKGEILGKVGTLYDNGGWAPHIHVETYYNLYSYKIKNLKRYALEDVTDRYKIGRILWSIIPWGTFEKLGGEKILKPEEYLLNKGLFNPNNIFNFYNDKDETVILK